MHTNLISSILALVSTCSLLLAVPSSVNAAESATYTLYENTETVDSVTLGSDSFSLNEAGETWTAFPLKSTTFQVVTAPPTQESESSSSASSTASSQSADTSAEQPSGGHRGHGTTTTGGLGHSSAPSKPQEPETVRTPQVPTPVEQAPSTPGSSASSVSYPAYFAQHIEEMPICDTHLFMVTDERPQSCTTVWSAASTPPTFGAWRTLLLLILGWCLGILTHCRLCQKPVKKRKKSS